MQVLKALPGTRRACPNGGSGEKNAAALHDALSVSDSLTYRVSLPWFLKDISGLHYDRQRGPACTFS